MEILTVNEVMRNDWISVDSVPMKVIKVTGSNIYCYGGIMNDSVDPVLISREILKSNGFTLTESGKFHTYSKKGLSIIFDKDTFEMNGIKYKSDIYPVKYKWMHKLQQFLRTIDDNLYDIANNFKIKKTEDKKVVNKLKILASEVVRKFSDEESYSMF